MIIQEFIKKHCLLSRLQRNGVLVVYDPERRYRELCQQLADATLQVIDATDSSIESREAALRALGQLGQPGTKLEGLLTYVPASAPHSDEDKQHDPFALYTACGSVFPEGDGDEFISLCLKAKPDHATDIRRLFEQHAQPSFAMIDAVGSGSGWPALRALLGRESARTILLALLAPDERQTAALGGGDGWVSEARTLFQSSLGLTLKTRGKTWSAIADELWRFVLFSEFVFDLPEPLPDALANVPRAGAAARPLIEDLCEQLRSDRRSQATYIERATAIEDELNLLALCAGLRDLGTRDTFPFEERSVMRQALSALEKDDTDGVRAIHERRAHYSVWAGKGESQVQWGLIRSALQLMEACADYRRQLPEHSRSQDALLDYYLTSLREVDRLQREFEQAVGDDWDSGDQLQAVIRQARGRYRQLIGEVQTLFTRHLESAGWPPAGRLANADVFDRLLAPKLQDSGHRVAYLLVDALRYELGVALHQQLSEQQQASLQAAYAQLPSITAVGMASLLPGAGQTLQLKKTDNGLQTLLGEQPVGNVGQRVNILRKRYGQRFAEMPLNDFVRAQQPIDDAVDLLVLRSVDIDSQLENNPETTLSLIQGTLKRIRLAIHKLEQQGFQEAVIVTDHGFFLNGQAEAGDVCTKPAGDWHNVHERCLLGDGAADANHYTLPADRLGIRGDFARLAGPRSMAPYRAGLLYFHGGASLQECVVPVITVTLRRHAQPAAQQATVSLSYKNGAQRITTRLPVVEVSVESQDLFSRSADFEILLEAHDRRKQVVGEARPGGAVNPATGTVTLKPGQTERITLKMQLEFEGKFTLRALNPTTLAEYCALKLETDYTV